LAYQTDLSKGLFGYLGQISRNPLTSPINVFQKNFYIRRYFFLWISRLKGIMLRCDLWYIYFSSAYVSLPFRRKANRRTTIDQVKNDPSTGH
jgi:hypothetical protein